MTRKEDEIKKLLKEHEELLKKVEELTKKVEELLKKVEKKEEEKKYPEISEKEYEKLFEKRTEEYNVFMKLKERIEKEKDVEYLKDLYIRVRELYPFMSEIFYESVLEITKKRLKELDIPFCPAHDVPLFEKVTPFGRFLACPVNGELFVKKDEMLLPYTEKVKRMIEMVVPKETVDPIPKAKQYSRIFEIPEDIKEKIVEIVNEFIINYENLARKCFEELNIEPKVFSVRDKSYEIVKFIHEMEKTEAPAQYMKELGILLYKYIDLVEKAKRISEKS